VKRVEVGYVARAHGVRGMVRVAGAQSDALGRLRSVFVGDEERAIAAAQPVADGWLLKLAGVDDRDAAEALRGRALSARREDLPPPAADEVYVADLVGCALYDLAGVEIGTVTAVQPGAAQELLVVARPSGGEALVPLVAPIVVEVDVAGRRIVCDPPEGLLDL
jgi:16S rRNA processing protein RimM